MQLDTKPLGVPTDIKPGTKLAIVPVSRAKADSDFKLSSTFETDRDETHFVIAAPFYHSGLYPMRMDDMVHVSYAANKMRYDFDARVCDRLKRDELYYVVLARANEIVRTQRRKDFRVELAMDAVLLQETTGVQGLHMQQHDSQTVDISGGGAGVRVNAPLREKDAVMLRFHLPGVDEPLQFVGDVRWVTRQENDAYYNFSCGLQFNFKQKTDKERLVKNLFRIQQQRMRTDVNRPPLEQEEFY